VKSPIFAIPVRVTSTRESASYAPACSRLRELAPFRKPRGTTSLPCREHAHTRMRFSHAAALARKPRGSPPMKRKAVFSHLLLVCVAIALFACGSDPSQSGDPAQERAGAEPNTEWVIHPWPPIHICLSGVFCGNTCMELDDPNNCGACGVSCGTGACNGDHCCGPGQAVCGNQCTEVFLDPNNCGACGHVCGNGQCAGGECCPEGFTACGDLCVNLKSNTLNCGACGGSCTLLGHSCQDGVCKCNPGVRFCS
jgi:hypothetical protein